jgi:hypothetical protein
MPTFNLSNKIKIVNPVANIDDDYGPYNSIGDAETAIPSIVRKGGKTVGILENGIPGDKVVEYWWEDDNATTLVRKIPILESVNLQKVITSNYTITNTDNEYTIFINNSATNITVTINTTITIPNFCVGFIQEGTGDVTFTGTSVTLTNPTGLKSKGQGYQTFIERKLSTSTFYLLGNTKA